MVAVENQPLPRMTVEEFAQIDEPGRFDLVDGEVWALPATSIPHGRYTVRFMLKLGNHVLQHGGGEVFGGELGFLVDPAGRTVLCPDVSFVRTDRQPGEEEKGFFPGAPDLAVEVISPSERPRQVQKKVARYLEAGTLLVWCVYPEQRQVIVYAEDAPPRMLGATDMLDGGNVLPGFQLSLSEIFEP